MKYPKIVRFNQHRHIHHFTLSFYSLPLQTGQGWFAYEVASTDFATHLDMRVSRYKMAKKRQQLSSSNKLQGSLAMNHHS